MSIRKIYQYPEPVLRKKARKIEDFTPELKVLIEDMAETIKDDLHDMEYDLLSMCESLRKDLKKFQETNV